MENHWHTQAEGLYSSFWWFAFCKSVPCVWAHYSLVWFLYHSKFSGFSGEALRASYPILLKCLDCLQNTVSSCFPCCLTLTADVAPNHIIFFRTIWLDMGLILPLSTFISRLCLVKLSWREIKVADAWFDNLIESTCPYLCGINVIFNFRKVVVQDRWPPP